MCRRIIENCLAIGHAAKRKSNFKPGFDAIILAFLRLKEWLGIPALAGYLGVIWDSGAGAVSAKYGDAAPFDAQGVSEEALRHLESLQVR